MAGSHNRETKSSFGRVCQIGFRRNPNQAPLGLGRRFGLAWERKVLYSQRAPNKRDSQLAAGNL